MKKNIFILFLVCAFIYCEGIYSQRNDSVYISLTGNALFNDIVLPDSLRSIDKEDAFFAKNKMRDIVISEKNGLQYIIVKEGYGLKPRPYDEFFIMEYIGYFINGTIFDSSESLPVQYDFNQIVRGLDSGIRKMPQGSHYIFYLPSKLG